MRLFFNYCHLNSYSDSDVKFGIGWYRHFKGHKWFGFSITLYLLTRMITINYVSNYKEYDKRINHRKYIKDKK